MALTERQRKAIACSNAILRIKGCIANLKSIKDNIFRSYILKGMINSIIISLEKLLEYMQKSKLSSYETYLDEYQTPRKL